MDTPESARWLVIWLSFVACCTVLVGNVVLIARLATRRRVSLAAKIIWPSLLASGVLCIVDAFVWEPEQVQLTHHEIRTPKLARGSGLRIAQLTDFHLVGKLGRRELKAVQITKSQRPDLIVLTGDYTAVKTPQALRALQQMTVMLTRIAPVYAVEGNWDSAEDCAALQKGGATVLDRWQRIRCQHGGNVALGHAEWYRGGITTPPKELSRSYQIVLCHSPAHFQRLAEKGVDLVLSGHTHGGQVRLPIFGALLPARSLVGKYQAGFYRMGSSLMYVNRGLGTEAAGAPKVRFFMQTRSGRIPYHRREVKVALRGVPNRLNSTPAAGIYVIQASGCLRASGIRDSTPIPMQSFPHSV